MDPRRARLDFSIRFNAPFNARARLKIAIRIIGAAVIKTRWPERELGHD